MGLELLIPKLRNALADLHGTMPTDTTSVHLTGGELHAIINGLDLLASVRNACR